MQVVSQRDYEKNHSKERPQLEKKEDTNLLILLHLSQLLYFLTFLGGFLVPLILWLVKKDEIKNMDEQGKEVINFQISTFIYSIICIPLILLFGLGIIGLIIIGIFLIIYPIINAIYASNNQYVSYPFTIKFLR